MQSQLFSRYADVARRKIIQYIDTDASINNTQEYTLVYVFVRSANSELTYKSAEQFI